MNNKSLWKKINIFTISMCLLVLVIMVYRASDMLPNSVNNYFKLDKKTSNYISFNYAGGDINSIYEINKPKSYNDKKAKRFVRDYYDFEINLSDDKEKVDYDIILKDMGNNIDWEYIKVYLTNQNNEALLGFDKEVPVYSMFSDNKDGKVIYSGKLTKNSDNKFRLRIWISDKYKEKYDFNLAFQVKVK